MAAWATGAWATNAWYGTAWATGTAPPIVVEDTHDGVKREAKRHKEKNTKRREDLVSAYNKAFGIEEPVPTEPAELIQAVEEQLSKGPDLAEVERKVIEKLLADYRQYERERVIYDRKVLEDEWDDDAMLAIAHLVN